MPLTPGTRLGPYEILAPLGAGGMGEVYLARDSRLNRDVALKILPDTFATDVDRLARFRREAQVLASLNHPNIGHIYGLEDSTAAHALVLELIEGPTLADRIAQGPIPLAEALPIARQIAEALEAAHEHGVVHRDLKPANIKVRDDGTVKVLDFGLAKALDPTTSRAPEALNSPTLTAPTQMGMILGTAAYMSPEQAKGKTVDRRADIWAFGAVCYEMLSGRRAFEGDDVSDTLAAVLRQEIEWSALPASTPEPVRRLLARCLDRDVKRRLRDIGEARIVLQDPAASEIRPDISASPAPLAPAVAARRPLWQRAMPAVVAAIVAGALGATIASYLKPDPPAPVMRFPLTLPDGQTFSGTARRVLDLSPDGAHLVFVSNNRLYLRSMSELESTPIQGLEGLNVVSEPTFSPDGRAIAFWAASDQTIKRIAITGGAAVTVCPAESPFGISWDAGGITFGQGDKGIMRVSANGGQPQALVTLEQGEFARGPQMLPGGQAVMFTVATGAATDRWDKARIVVQPLPSGARKTIVDGGADGRYLPTGHVVYAHGGSLFAVAFDLGTLEATSGPVSIVEGVSRASTGGTGAVHFGISNNGTLIYRPGPLSFGLEAMTFGFSDKSGRAAELLKMPPGGYEAPRISPDGTRIAFQMSGPKQADVWIVEVTAGTAIRRLTFGGNNRFPVWSGDGTRVAFQSDRDGDLAIFWQPADGSTANAERLTKSQQGEAHVPHTWSPKSQTLLFDVTKGGDTSLWMLTLPEKTMQLGAVRSTNPTGAVFSPDGRWVAYSVTAGATTVYVEPFPPTGAKFELFRKPGDNPHEATWSPDGKELYYNPRPAGFEAVSVTTSPAFAFGNPVAVPRPFVLGPPAARRSYDVAPDGRFLGLIRPGQVTATGATNQEIRVVLNWFEEIKARVPR